MQSTSTKILRFMYTVLYHFFCGLCLKGRVCGSGGCACLCANDMKSLIKTYVSSKQTSSHTSLYWSIKASLFVAAFACVCVCVCVFVFVCMCLCVCVYFHVGVCVRYARNNLHVYVWSVMCRDLLICFCYVIPSALTKLCNRISLIDSS